MVISFKCNCSDKQASLKRSAHKLLRSHIFAPLSHVTTDFAFILPLLGADLIILNILYFRLVAQLCKCQSIKPIVSTVRRSGGSLN